jgi:hypothetical protein
MAESIYNLIPQPVPVPVKDPIYRSKHPGDVPPTFSTFGITNTSKPGYTNVSGAQQKRAEGHHEYKKGFATMGKDGNAVPPSEVLKKKTGGGGGPRADVPLVAPSGGLACTQPPVRAASGTAPSQCAPLSRAVTPPAGLPQVSLAPCRKASAPPPHMPTSFLRLLRFVPLPGDPQDRLSTAGRRRNQQCPRSPT